MRAFTNSMDSFLKGMLYAKLPSVFLASSPYLNPEEKKILRKNMQWSLFMKKISF
jgi:hypothetical protein